MLPGWLTARQVKTEDNEGQSRSLSALTTVGLLINGPLSDDSIGLVPKYYELRREN